MDRVTAAQAADELLNIKGVERLLCGLPPDGDGCIMSARSMGDINVQVILEALGGGGNAATAGGQVESGRRGRRSIQRLMEAIDQYFEK